MKLISTISTAILMLLGVVFLISPANAASVTLKQGVDRPAVKTLQQYLDNSAKGDFFTYSAGVYTTYFGSATAGGLKRWQNAMGYDSTGIITVGDGQWNQLKQQYRPLSATLRTIDHRTLAWAKSQDKAIDINKRTRKLALVTYNKTTKQYRVAQALDVRVGDARGPQYVTRDGDWKIYLKEVNHYSTLYNVNMPYSMFFSGGEAIHYSADFARVGYSSASHGCANIRNKQGMASLYKNSFVGEHVVVHS